MWHKQSFTQFWSQSDAYSRRSSLKLTYIHHPLVVCTHQICCAVAVPIALSQDRLLHGHNRLVNWTPCSRMRESKLIKRHTEWIFLVKNYIKGQFNFHWKDFNNFSADELHLMSLIKIVFKPSTGDEFKVMANVLHSGVSNVTILHKIKYITLRIYTIFCKTTIFNLGLWISCCWSLTS